MNIISILLIGVLSENIIINKFFGIYFIEHFLEDKNKLMKAMIITLIVTFISAITNNFIYKNLLVQNDITYLKTLVFIAVILIFTTIILLIFKLITKEKMADYFNLILLNNVILGISLLVNKTEYDIIELVIYTIGLLIGYLSLSYILKSINDKLERSPINKYFRGLPVYFITLFIVSMLFTRYIFG